MNIVVGYEESPFSEKALALAMQYASIFGAKVHVVTSILSDPGPAAQKMVEGAEEALSKAKLRVEAENIPCETHVLVRGQMPGEDVVEFARELGADQIVIGVRKASKVGKLLFGSNAQYIILNASCPVVTVR